MFSIWGIGSRRDTLVGTSPNPRKRHFLRWCSLSFRFENEWDEKHPQKHRSPCGENYHCHPKLALFFWPPVLLEILACFGKVDSLLKQSGHPIWSIQPKFPFQWPKPLNHLPRRLKDETTAATAATTTTTRRTKTSTNKKQHQIC